MEDARATKIFNYINRLFWVIWALLPFCIAKAIPWLAVSPDLTFIDEGSACTPAGIKSLSEHGHYAALAYFGFNTLLSLVLFALMHYLVHGFAKGRVFIQKTLAVLNYISALVIVWPVADMLLYNLIAWYLVSIGDIPAFTPDLAIDVITLGCGFFLLVIRVILTHALKLHEESQLTV